jgi:hypothetical protein
MGVDGFIAAASGGDVSTFVVIHSSRSPKSVVSAAVERGRAGVGLNPAQPNFPQIVVLSRKSDFVILQAAFGDMTTLYGG